MPRSDHPSEITLIDLAAQQLRIRDRLDAAIARVLDHGKYIMGPEVTDLERGLALFCGARHAIACANGTDALILALMAKGLQPGEAVIVPSFTFCATAEAVCVLGAIPIYADILSDTFNIDPESVKRGIETARAQGLRLRGVISVDLFGQPCDYDRLEPLVRDAGLFLVCDAAQAFGAHYRGRRVGTFGDITTTSFFPAKPLGCYGDGGALFTDDDETAAILGSLRIHGQGQNKYHNVRVGLNSRLDTLQAAILLEKLAIFPEEITRRQQVAERYGKGLPVGMQAPHVVSGANSVWAQYSVLTDNRDTVLAALRRSGVPAAIYYTVPLHQQPAYGHYAVSAGGVAATESVAARIFSLPMHPWMSREAQMWILDALHCAS